MGQHALQERQLGLGIGLGLDLCMTADPECQEMHHVVQVLVPKPMRLMVEVQQQASVLGGYLAVDGLQVRAVALRALLAQPGLKPELVL